MRYLKFLLFVGTLLVSGCATHFYKNGATQEAYNKDMQECEYDATKYGYVQSNYYGGGYGAAIGSGIGTGLAQGMRQREIIMKCMAVKGWSVVKKEEVVKNTSD